MELIILCLTLYFDTSQGSFQEMNITLWRKAYSFLLSLNELSTELYSEISSKENINAKNDDDEEDNIITKNYVLNLIQGSILSFLERLEQELYKGLQFTEYNNRIDYIERIKDEIRLIDLCILFINNPIILSSGNQNNRPHINLILIMHLYYRKSENVKQILSKSNLEECFLQNIFNEISSKLDNKSKIKAYLAYVYYKALNNDFQIADEMFKKTNLTQIVNCLREESIKVLYNRTIANLGLSAFRASNFTICKHYLSPICSSGTNKLRDNLFQTNEKISNLDKEEKKKLIPYIMTLNIDEIENAYYISSLIVDTDKILLSRLGLTSFDSFFKRQVDSYEKQIFNGNPESNKQAILDSVQHILKGNYNKAYSILLSRNEIKNYEQKMNGGISEVLKNISLKCYLILYQFEFNSLDIASLLEKFGYSDKRQIRKVINRLILDNNLDAKWESNDILIFFNNSLSDVKFSKKISQLKKNIDIISNNNILLLEQAAR